ncbi:MAG: hypothetical protein QGI84_02500 [Dehalococcoidia bacterium]|nr:hypothetical protein [Dehalococcoidia bacterium]
MLRFGAMQHGGQALVEGTLVDLFVEVETAMSEANTRLKLALDEADKIRR